MATETRQEAFGLEVRARLVRARLSTNDLVRTLDISQPQVSARLKGDIEWRLDELWKVADLLDVPLAELIAAVDQPTPARAFAR